jgi:hypothetical protein
MRRLFFLNNGDPRRTRTFDPMVKSHLLYRLSYRTTRRVSSPHVSKGSTLPNVEVYTAILRFASNKPAGCYLNQLSITESCRMIV